MTLGLATNCASGYGRRVRGPLESRYLQVHPDATTGIAVCAFCGAVVA